jgi:3-polyprenyl-4-hydroxybenzoate decarboxylase
MSKPDTERFRLRRFVEKLVQQGECVEHDAPIDLIDVAAVLDGNPKAVWFRAVGPERAELVGNVMGARRRLALGFNTDEANFAAVLRERLNHPVAPIEVPAAAAPVQDVVLTGRSCRSICSMASMAHPIFPPASTSCAIGRRAGPISGAGA